MNARKLKLVCIFLILFLWAYIACSSFLKVGKGTGPKIKKEKIAKNLGVVKDDGDKLSKENAYHFALLGKMEELDGDLGKALKNYTQALEFDPDSSYINLKISEIYFSVSDLEKALDYVNNSILKEPDFIDSYLIRGQILIRKRDTEKAKADFLKVIDLDKENEIANWELGKIYFDSNEFDKAIDYFKNTLNINPRSFITLRELGFVYLQMKMYDKSIELLTKAKEQNPFDRSVVKLLTFAYEESKNLKECDRVINEYLKFFPNDFEMTSRLTYINYLEKEPLQAINVWKRYISTGVSDERAHFRLAVIYEQIGQFAFAEVELKKAIEINPKYYIAKNYLGYMYADRGTNLDESLKLITEALKGEPDNGSYLDSLGWIYFKKGDCVNAEKFLLKALELNPDESMINEHLGDVYYKMGKYEKAIEQWEKSLQTNPNNNEAQKKLMKIRI